MAINARRVANNQRAEDAYSMYKRGATLEEVGREFGVTRERVRQIFRDRDLPIRSVKEAAALKRALQSREYAESIKRRFAELRDADAVARELKLPRPVVTAVVEAAFTTADRRKPKRARKLYSDDELIGFLRAASAALGGVLTAQVYTAYARTQKTNDGRPWPTHQTYLLRFGSWRKAVTAAGLAANPSSPIVGQTLFGDGHCVDALRAAARSLGRPPTASEYDDFARSSNGALPSEATVRHRLGRWYQALDRAGL